MQNTPQAPTSQSSVDPNQFGNYSNWAQSELAKGASADDLHQVLAAHGITNYGQAPQPQTQPQQSHDSGNWFTHLLPTVGSIGGTILGGLATGGLGGEFVGGGAGGAIGKGLENLLEGKNPISADDLTAGAEGAIGAGVGGAIGKGLGALGGLAKGAAKTATDAATQDAAQAATKNAVTDLATEYGDVPYKIQELYGGKNTTNFVKGLGFEPTSDNLVSVGSNANSHLNRVLDDALGQTSPVDLSNYSQIVKDAIAKADPNGNILGSYDKIAIRPGYLGSPKTPASQVLDQLEQIAAGTAKTNSDPLEVRDLTTRLFKAGQEAKPTSVNQTTGAIDQEQLAKYHAINNVRDAIKDALYNRDEVNNILTPLQGNLTHVDTLGNQALADHLNKIVTKAGTNGNSSAAQDLLNAIKHNINVENFGQEGQKVKQIITSSAGKNRLLAEQGIPAGNATAVDPSTGSPLNLAQDFAQAKGAGGKTFVLAKHVATNPNVLGTLGRIGGLADKITVGGTKLADGTIEGGRMLPGLAPVLGAGIGAGNAQLSEIQPANGTMGGTMIPGQQDPSQGATTPSGGLSRNDLLTLALYSPSAFGALTAPSADNQAKVSAANTAEQALSSLGPAPNGGILSQIGGSLGIGSAGAYQRQAASAAQQIAAALPGSNANTIEGELTNYMAGGGNINDAIQKLLANLQAVKQNNTNGAYQSLMNYNPSVINAAGL